jgi:hypothetical protein
MGPFVVVGVFVAVILLGLACGTWYFVRSVTGRNAAPQSAPSAEAYRVEVASVARPFLAQALKMDDADLAAAGADLADLVAKTQERVLRLRVPGSERDAHLGLVLLLEQWKRAVSGDAESRSSVLERTRAFVNAHPWIQQ